MVGGDGEDYPGKIEVLNRVLRETLMADEALSILAAVTDVRVLGATAVIEAH